MEMETVGHILDEKGSKVYLARPDTTVFEAVEEMCTHRVGALLVCEGNNPVGVFSERDLRVRVILARRDPATTLVRDVMTHEVVCVSRDIRPAEAMAMITERRCRHLPVVEGGRVTGMISIGDLVRYFSQNQEYEIKMLRDYVDGRYPA
jgi:CBS domain-containing protein